MGGGNAQDVQAKLEELESRLNGIEEKEQELQKLIYDTNALRADLESYGMVKLSNTTNITDSTGLALPVTEKNPDIENTLGKKISDLQGRFRTDIILGAGTSIPLNLSKRGYYILFIAQFGGWDKKDEGVLIICRHENEQTSKSWYEWITGGDEIKNQIEITFKENFGDTITSSFLGRVFISILGM